MYSGPDKLALSSREYNLLCREKSEGRLFHSYIIESTDRLYLDAFVKTILKALNKPESLITYVTDRPGHDLRYAIDSTKAEKELGWNRTYTFEKGIEETIDCKKFL